MQLKSWPVESKLFREDNESKKPGGLKEMEAEQLKY
jgi:hypothetical protein